jgi:MoaD family protein
MPIVNLYANLRTIAGKKEMSLPGLSIQEVLERLVQEHPGVQGFLLDGEKIRPRLIITLNGRILNPQTCLQTAVSEQDQIGVFPPVAGG